jgi:DNA polymerase-3 subunit delta
VEAVRGAEPGASVFDLAAAIGARDRGRLLRVLARNLEAGEAPLRILGSLAWQYRRIWKAKDQLRQGGTESEAARMLRMPPFKVRRFLDQFSEPSLQAAFRMFLDTDSKLKGGSAGKPKRVLESLLFTLSAGPAPAGRAAAGAAAGPESRPRTPPGTRPIQNG